MTTAEERSYVRGWAEASRRLEAIKWRELRELDDAAALHATEYLLDAAMLVPLPENRRSWSGLVDLQALLHRRRT